MEEILDLLAWNDPAPMSISLAAATLDKKVEELTDLFKNAVDSGALKKAKGDNRYEITPAVQAERRKQFPLSDNPQWVVRTAQHLGDWFDARRKDYNNQTILDEEMPHLETWTAHVSPFSLYHAARLTWLQAYPPYFRGKFQKALELVRAAQALLDQVPADEALTDKNLVLKLKADLFHDLAAVYDELKNTDEALNHYRKALELQETHFGRQHADTADTISNIAATYDRMGNREEALKYFREALEIRRQLFGEKHAETAASINNIGSSFYEAGKYADAIHYLEKAVEIRMEVLGPEHTDTNDSLYNLAVCFTNLKKLKQAYEMVAKQLKLLAPGHPNYNELMGMLSYIDRESVKSGFRPMSAVNKGGKKKKKKKR
jgi:tetratricopeptide (TPR) repeat protein